MEIWKPVVFEPYSTSYMVSNLGRIRSINRIDCGGNRRLGKILSIPINTAGYCHCTLKAHGEHHTFRIHQLVATAFHGVPKEGIGYGQANVNHINGIKTDNRAENLEWVTSGENKRHAYKTGLNKHRGSVHFNSVLTEKDIPRIRELKKMGYSAAKIANEYKCCRQNILKIINRKTWHHI